MPAEEGGKSSLAPGLYITATPIGNAADITLRALKVLGQCDAIVAEDSRVTSRLLAIHGISRPLLVYNDHNAPSVRPKLIEKLRGGARLALVSDAGTPLISDPGHKLVKAAREAGIAVYPVPGPSAAVAALSAAGLPTDRFLFAGFLPSKSGERGRALEELKVVPATLIFYESPQRLADTLTQMAEILGPRPAVVAREVTKLHEEFREGPLDRLAATYADEAAPKGEITLLVGPPAEAEIDRSRIDSMLRQTLPFMPLKAASALIAEATGASKREIYDRGLALQAGRGDGAES
jgi:16S rRNA (cytidine1402-2'-O)-methyltransferase